MILYHKTQLALMRTAEIEQTKDIIIVTSVLLGESALRLTTCKCADKSPWARDAKTYCRFNMEEQTFK